MSLHYSTFRRSRQGIYFTIDGLFAAMLVVLAAVLYLTISHSVDDAGLLQSTAEDGVTVLTTIRVGEFNHSLTQLVIATNVTNENESVLRAIAALWATNNSLAPIYTQTVLMQFLPTASFAIYAETDLLYNRTLIPQTAATHVATAKQQVSGIAYARPISGNTATAYLKKIENKSTASYAYFGGFVGQGNLTFTLPDLPLDISAATIRDVLLELDTPASFTLEVNGVDCGSYVPVYPTTTEIEQWNVVGCEAAFVPGDNDVALVFTDPLTISYVSGGFLRVRYVTNEDAVDPGASPRVIALPGIDGIINLYDGFTVPGNLTNITVYLHYLANHSGPNQNNTFYLTIGNVTVYRDNTSLGTQMITLTDANLSSILNYSQLSGTTVPFRIGFENLTFSAIYLGAADVMLVTDTSGSMDWRMDLDDVDGVKRECRDPNINASSTQRLSVAKCLDIQFATDILNVTGNVLGLVNYASSTQTASTVPLTTNFTRINQTIGNTTSGYVANGGTCICCGINSALAQLNASLLRTSLLAQGSNWVYWFSNGTTAIPQNDTSNRSWFDPSYSNASAWPSGPAILGSAENGTGPALVTDMGNSFFINAQTPELWDMALDNATPAVDFTSGMNSTANTFGYAAANDGWDWQGGTYGYGNSVLFAGAIGGTLRMYLNTSPSNRNNCANNDCSGAYGVSINITPSLWATLQNNGQARLSFRYQWDSNPTNPFDNSDEVWIKARWINTSGTTTYLGSEQSNSGADSTVEVDRRNNPDSDFSGTYTRDITSLISGPGMYYFDAGVKLYADATNKWGTFQLDDVSVQLTNQTDVYYLRTTFNVANLSRAQTALLNVLSDDRATVYVNGVLVLDEGFAHSAQYWNSRGVAIDPALLQLGSNSVAVRLENTRGTAKFDARIDGLNTSRTLAMLVMTDGVANDECSAQNTGSESGDAILASCQAKERFGVTVHTVGFSTTADAQTLSDAAVCAGGLFTSSANTTELADFYRNVVLNILDSSIKSQSIVTTGNYQESQLYDDSYLRFNFNASTTQTQPNEILVTTQTPALGSCTPTVQINPLARVLEARMTSYSGEHWTSYLGANGQSVYNLSGYQTPFIALGDPYIVQIPPAVLMPGSNSFVIETADGPSNTTGCSGNNTLITDLALQLSTAYTPVVTQAIGCTWTIEHDVGTVQTIPVPSGYFGSNVCEYTNASIIFNSDDAYDVATYNLLRTLDYDGDGRIFISLREEDIEIIVTRVSNVPYLWGPSLLEVRVWR